jgi:hypothetical protein
MDEIAEIREDIDATRVELAAALADARMICWTLLGRYGPLAIVPSEPSAAA